MTSSFGVGGGKCARGRGRAARVHCSVQGDRPAGWTRSKTPLPILGDSRSISGEFPFRSIPIAGQPRRTRSRYARTKQKHAASTVTNWIKLVCTFRPTLARAVGHRLAVIFLRKF